MQTDDKPLPKILLHCCCAPCASYVLECLTPQYNVSLLFYNPNIEPQAEHEKREKEIARLLEKASLLSSVDVIDCDYDNAAFENVTLSLRDEPEGGLRCNACFELRLRETARRAQTGKYDVFGTTLTVSPHKNANLINEIGNKLAKEYHVEYLQSDFKKNNGYKRSAELSKQYGLYRQNYCGCVLNE